jgi:hypothetical protein
MSALAHPSYLMVRRIFELENEKKENAVKVLLIKDYEKQIEKLRKAEAVWCVNQGIETPSLTELLTGMAIILNSSDKLIS